MVFDGSDDSLLSHAAFPNVSTSYVMAAAIYVATATGNSTVGLGSDSGLAFSAQSAAANPYWLSRADGGGTFTATSSLTADLTKRAVVLYEFTMGASATHTIRTTAGGTVTRTDAATSAAAAWVRMCLGGFYRGGVVNSRSNVRVSEVVLASTLTDSAALLDYMEAKWPLS